MVLPMQEPTCLNELLKIARNQLEKDERILILGWEEQIPEPFFHKLFLGLIAGFVLCVFSIWFTGNIASFAFAFFPAFIVVMCALARPSLNLNNFSQMIVVTNFRVFMVESETLDVSAISMRKDVKKIQSEKGWIILTFSDESKMKLKVIEGVNL